ncbi:hypothetical protein EON83_16335 [bacterium]|nr:MAG: hypothetical protein EON83_16335 [bacterium]
MKPVFRFAPIFLTAVMASASMAAPRPMFTPAQLATCDGTGWAGLMLGQTSFKDIRARYDTGDGAFERSTQLTQPKNSGLRVDCLWNKVGQDEVLSAVALRYTGVTPSSDQLQQAFDPEGNQGEALYYSGRYEDWRVVRFPQRGVTAFQLRQGENYSTPLLVLSPPNSLASLSQPLVHEETPVEERIDPMANEPKIGQFGEIIIDFVGKETDVIPPYVRSDLRDDLRDANAGGTLRWSRGAAGYYRLRVTGTDSKKKDNGSFSVTTEIQAQGPYGPVSVTGSGTDRWKNDDGHPPSYAFDRAMKEARRDAELKFENAMLASGPPTLEAVREGHWRDLVTLLRSPQVAAPVGVGTGPTGPVQVPGF